VTDWTEATKRIPRKLCDVEPKRGRVCPPLATGILDPDAAVVVVPNPIWVMAVDGAAGEVGRCRVTIRMRFESTYGFSA